MYWLIGHNGPATFIREQFFRPVSIINLRFRHVSCNYCDTMNVTWNWGILSGWSQERRWRSSNLWNNQIWDEILVLGLTSDHYHFLTFVHEHYHQERTYLQCKHRMIDWVAGPPPPEEDHTDMVDCPAQDRYNLFSQPTLLRQDILCWRWLRKLKVELTFESQIFSGWLKKVGY